ncbi:hypothetical protein [Natrinema hispanicum]|nr:hypothetical protein [Natrinema hispanicum]
MYRREVLQTMSVGAVALGGGCSGLLDSRGSSYLEDVTIKNGDDIAHDFELTVKQADSVVHEATVELEGTQTLATVACEWSGRGPFVVTCTLDGDSTETVRIDDAIQQGAGEYAQVTFTVTEMAELDWSGFLDDGGRECPRSASN